MEGKGKMAQFTRTNWLDAETVATETDAAEVSGATSYALQVARTGDPTSADVTLQGSIDGVTWSALGAATGGASDQIVWVSDRPVKYIRLKLFGLTGGSFPSVSASVIAI